MEEDIIRKRKCTDVLVATGWVGKNPEIYVFNPCNINFPQEGGKKEALKPPEFESRKDIQALSDDSEVEDEKEGKGDPMDTDSSLTSAVTPEKDVEQEKKKGKGWKKGKGKAAPPLPAELDSHFPTLMPWTIKPKGFVTAAREVAAATASEPIEAIPPVPQTPKKANGSAAAKALEQANKFVPSAKVNTVIRCTAFSPGGAEWLVGVGEWGSVIVYRLITQVEVDGVKRVGSGTSNEQASEMDSTRT